MGGERTGGAAQAGGGAASASRQKGPRVRASDVTTAVSDRLASTSADAGSDTSRGGGLGEPGKLKRARRAPTTLGASAGPSPVFSNGLGFAGTLGG
jgi:hypothetical protein